MSESESESFELDSFIPTDNSIIVPNLIDPDQPLHIRTIIQKIEHLLYMEYKISVPNHRKDHLLTELTDLINVLIEQQRYLCSDTYNAAISYILTDSTIPAQIKSNLQEITQKIIDTKPPESWF